MGVGIKMASIKMRYGVVGGGSVADVQKFQVKGGRKSLNEMILGLWLIYLAVVTRACCAATETF